MVHRNKCPGLEHNRCVLSKLSIDEVLICDLTAVFFYKICSVCVLEKYFTLLIEKIYFTTYKPVRIGTRMSLPH